MDSINKFNNECQVFMLQMMDGWLYVVNYDISSLHNQIGLSLPLNL